MKWRCPLLCALALALLLAGTVPGAAADTAAAPVATVPAARAADAATQTPAGERKDLTVFFSVGVILDLLLVGAFAAWAIRQWRKSR